MALQITGNQGIFEIKGQIVSNNAKSFKKHFEYLLEDSKKVIINISNVEKIDLSGVNAFKAIYRKALESGKKLSIIGLGSRDLYLYLRKVRKKVLTNQYARQA